MTSSSKCRGSGSVDLLRTSPARTRSAFVQKLAPAHGPLSTIQRVGSVDQLVELPLLSDGRVEVVAAVRRPGVAGCAGQRLGCRSRQRTASRRSVPLPRPRTSPVEEPVRAGFNSAHRSFVPGAISAFDGAQIPACRRRARAPPRLAGPARGAGGPSTSGPRAVSIDRRAPRRDQRGQLGVAELLAAAPKRCGRSALRHDLPAGRSSR